LKPDDYMVGFDINMVGMETVLASNTSFLAVNWKADLLKQEKSVDNMNGSTIYYKHLNDDVEYLSETKDEELSVKTRVKWVSFKQRFFTSTLIAGNQFDNADMSTVTKPDKTNPRYLKSMETTVELPFSLESAKTIPMSFYFGPNKFTELKSYHLDLERQIPLGWSFFLLAWINIYIVIPVFTFLGSYGWNYGIVILVLTVLLKTILFPIAYKTYTSSAKMRVLKPEVDEISAKFPKTEDAMKKQQAVMALYKKAGANPMSGCVPMLLQMPILIAMFRFFPSSIELRQQPFLWATDLSSYDSIWNLPWNIPFYGDHVSLFTLLMTVSTIIYTYLNNQMMGSQSTQMPGMKTMMYIMPVMFLGLFNNYAAGLSYYYFLANVITFGQMYIFRLVIDEDKVHAKIQENKKRPVKKSGFQARLEEAAKKRGYQMPKK
ncbi:MAG: membrane protein insertase YidC, partial [Bacteroidales bacterium]|nr:membrane protein insertase YidC [Bacteroidales bacterium]